MNNFIENKNKNMIVYWHNQINGDIVFKNIKKQKIPSCLFLNISN